MGEQICGTCDNWQHTGISGGTGPYSPGDNLERHDIKTGICLKTEKPYSNGDACDCDGWEPKK